MDQFLVDVQDETLHGKRVSPLHRPDRWFRQVSVRKPADPRVPVPVRLVELLERLVSGPRVGERVEVDFLAAEVPPDPIAQAPDDAVEVPRGRMLQQPRTGSQKYSSSVRPSSRGRRCSRQCQSSCSASPSLLGTGSNYAQLQAREVPITDQSRSAKARPLTSPCRG